MTYVPMDRLFRKTDSMFKLVTIASKRALQLSAGARKLVETKSLKPTTIALEEIMDSRIGYSKAGQ